MANQPTLKPPGAGIPRIQVVVAKNILLPLFMVRNPWDSVPGALRLDADRFIAEFDRERSVAEERVTRRVLIPPTAGLEDDSRYWSLAMTLDHLRRVNARMIEVVDSLVSGSPLPEGPNEIVDFKPDPKVGADVAARYRATTTELAARIERAPKSARAAKGTVHHPWFGPLTVRQWVPFTAMHQRIHATQWRRIRARL